MDQIAFYAGLIALLCVIVFFTFMLERQARQNNVMINFLVEQFKGISMTEANTHLQQIDSLITMNRDQADRHQKQIDSLLGLIDEITSRANPDRVTARQYLEFEKYLTEQAKNAR